MTGPTIGRIVHYRSFGTPGGEYKSECRAAIVTMAYTDTIVSLAVLNPSGLFFDKGIAYDEIGTHGGTWHWPCVITKED